MTKAHLKKTGIYAILATLVFNANAQTTVAYPPATMGQQNQPQQVQQQPAPQPYQMPQERQRVVEYPSPQELINQTVGEVQQGQLSPQQVDVLKDIQLQRDKSKSTPYLSPAKPITRSLMVNLDAGVEPPVLRLSRGAQTSVVFSDMNGNPWMIDRVSMNRDQFSDGMGGGGGEMASSTNILTLEPLTTAAFGNATVVLKGMNTPIILTLTSGQPQMDARVDAKIEGLNPDAMQSVQVSSYPTLDDSLTSFLDGTPPSSAKKLTVSGAKDIRAWSYNGNLYVRAKADALYPAYMSAAKSTSGMSIYRYSGVKNSVTLMAQGQTYTVFIK